MRTVSTPSRQMSWQKPRARLSLIADLAIRKEIVSRRLAELRAQHDLTQERAAARVGVTMRQWQRWEGGASIPYARNLDAVAAEFGFDVGDFYTDDEPEHNGHPAVSPLRALEERLASVEAKLDRQYIVLGDILAAIGEPDGLARISRAGRELAKLGRERAQDPRERPAGQDETRGRTVGD